MVIDYIPYMRKKIGHERMLSVGLCCLLINKKNEILLQKRSDNALYSLPGGSISLNETVTEGIKREFLEETGIQLQNVNLFYVRSGEKNQLTYPNGDVTDYVDFYFYSYTDLDNDSLPSVHDNESLFLKFYPMDSLPKEEEMLRGMNEVISYFKKDKTLKVD